MCSPISRIAGFQNGRLPSDFLIQLVLVYVPLSAKAFSQPSNLRRDVTVCVVFWVSVSNPFLLLAPSELDLSVCPPPPPFVEAVSYGGKKVT